jgi:predicted RNase H-like HicB family nuclease
MSVHTFTVVYEPAEDGGYYARVPALELTTEGRTIAEAKDMARDAIEGYLEAAQALGFSLGALTQLRSPMS